MGLFGDKDLKQLRFQASRGNRTRPSAIGRWMIGAAVVALLLSACTARDASDRGQTTSSILDPSSTAPTTIPASATISQPAIGGAPTDTLQGDTRSAFCAELDNIAEEAGRTGARVQSADEGSLAQLVALVGAVGDVQVYLERLRPVSPPEIEADLRAIRDAIQESVFEDGGSALQAVANSLLRGLLVQNSFTRVDAYAVAECGYPVFGSVVLSTAAQMSPRGAPEGGILIDPDNFYGENLCEGSLTPARSEGVTQGLTALRCGDELLVVLDTRDWTEVWRLDARARSASVYDFDASGGVVAVMLRTYVPASGLQPERESYVVEAYDLATGKQLWTREVPLHPDNLVLPNAGIDIEGVGPAGTTVYWKFVWDAERYSASSSVIAIDRAGNEVWTARDRRTPTLGSWIEVEDFDGFEQVVNVDTGRVAFRAPESGEYVLNFDQTDFSGCSPYLSVGKLLIDMRDGRSTSLPTFRFYSSVVIAEGLLVSNDQGLSLYQIDGSTAWTIPDAVIRSWSVIEGELVVENQSGQYVAVDPVTGTEAPNRFQWTDDLMARRPWVSVSEGWLIDQGRKRLVLTFRKGNWPDRCKEAY